MEGRPNSGRGPLDKSIDEEVFAWYEECRRRGNRPKSGQVQEKARELYQVNMTEMVFYL